jgi:hypothetical protein
VAAALTGDEPVEARREVQRQLGEPVGAFSACSADGAAVMRLVATSVATLATLTLVAAGGSDRLTLRPFVGAWTGHTRGLTINRAGLAKEFISDGCCDLVIRLTTRLSNPRRVGDSLVATATIVRARIFDRSAYGPGRPPPHVGDRGQFRLRRGVITERLTETTYCDARAARLGRCGA